MQQHVACKHVVTLALIWSRDGTKMLKQSVELRESAELGDNPLWESETQLQYHTLYTTDILIFFLMVAVGGTCQEMHDNSKLKKRTHGTAQCVRTALNVLDKCTADRVLLIV